MFELVVSNGVNGTRTYTASQQLSGIGNLKKCFRVGEMEELARWESVIGEEAAFVVGLLLNEGIAWEVQVGSHEFRVSPQRGNEIDRDKICSFDTPVALIIANAYKVKDNVGCRMEERRVEDQSMAYV